MVRRSQGMRNSTRHKLSRSKRERGLSPITRALQQFTEGNSVNIVIDPSIQKGQPHPRFHGLPGKVVTKQGDAYVVQVKVGKMPKQLIVRPEHLRPQRL